MVANRKCDIRNRKSACLEHCQNWVSNNFKSFPDLLESDLKKVKKYETYFDVNINVVILVSVFLVLCLIVFILFNLK